MMKEMVVEEVARGAVEALMRGDWTAYQRYLRGIPAQQEAALLKRIDEMLKRVSQSKQRSQRQ